MAINRQTLLRLSDGRGILWFTLAGSVVLAVLFGLQGHPLISLVWLAVTGFWLWQLRRAGARPATPVEVTVERAREVLAAAGSPQGIRALWVLRRAQPGLGLVDAAHLVDRVAAENARGR